MIIIYYKFYSPNNYKYSNINYNNLIINISIVIFENYLKAGHHYYKNDRPSKH